MENLSGCMTAKLADRDEPYDGSLVDEINQRIQPPRSVKPNEVHIRAMYIVSDQINSQGGRFAAEELDRLTELLIDSPVMVGHQRDSLPVARTFMASRVEIDGRVWVKSYFYWIREGAGAELLRSNIDGGIYKECSISFLFQLPECSVCGRDIRHCRHIPFQEYEIEPGRKEIAHFLYRRVEKVLETSLVFRGAIPDTRITDKLSPGDGDHDLAGRHQAETSFSKTMATAAEQPGNVTWGRAALRFAPLKCFEWQDRVRALFAYPYQPGLMIAAVKGRDGLELRSTFPLPEAIQRHICTMLASLPADSYQADFLLYATRGKQRLDAFGLMRMMASEAYRHRLRLRLCDLKELNGRDYASESYERRLARMQEWFAPLSSSSCEAIRPRQLPAAGQFLPTEGDDASGYAFGLELLAEHDDGRLDRWVLTKERLTPALVDRIDQGSGAHLSCTVRELGDLGQAHNAACPRTIGLDKNTVVLVRGLAENSGRSVRAMVIADLLPGVEAGRIISAPESLPPRQILYVKASEGRLTLYLRQTEGWQRITVHHFASALFRRGRRFIADNEPLDMEEPEIMALTQVPLESVGRAAALMSLRLRDRHALFGGVTGLWVRPALIDGRERYLFYGDQPVRDKGQGN